MEREYLDIPRIKEYLNANQELRYDDDGNGGLRLLIRALIFARFLKGWSRPEDESSDEQGGRTLKGLLWG